MAGVRRALEQLAAHPAAREQLADRARRRVLTHCTWDAKAAQVRAVWDWVLGRGPKPDYGMPL